MGFIADRENPNAHEEALRGLGLLDPIVKGPVGLGAFTDSLERMLDFHIPEGVETQGVQVTSIFELRGLEPEHLYLGGLKDGDLPARQEMDFLLPDSVRKRLGLLDLERHMRLQEHIFSRLVASSGGLHLSYPSMEGDKFFLPSLFLSGAQETEERIFGIFSDEERQTRQAKGRDDGVIQKIEGVERFKAKSPLNVTDIDAYRACPRRFYIERLLGLEPPEVAEYEVEARTMGSIIHEVMERLIGPDPLDYEAFRRKAERVLNSVLSDKPLEPYFKELIKSSFLRILPDILGLEEDLRSEGYTIGRAEHRLEGQPLEGIRLKGKIDRIDLKDGGSALVIDYKTGNAGLSSTATLKQGATLQPFLYAAMLKAEGLKPESVGIYSLKELALRRVPGNRDLKEGRTLDDFITAALGYLEETVRAMRRGDFSALPLSEANCWSCHERPYCPYIQGEA